MEKQKEKIPLKQRKKGERGITLIALVITIIVLLILAAVSIATLTGQNGILSRADDAKRENEIASVKEQARLDISNYIAEKLENGENSTVNTPEKVQEILEAANQNNENKYYKGFTETGITTPSGYEVPYEELYTTGSSGEGTTSKTVEDLVVGDKVYYDTGNISIGNQGIIECTVLYDKAYNEAKGTNYGIQIISTDVIKNSEGTVVTVPLGYNDNTVDGIDNFEKAKNSYNNALKRLYEEAQKYLNETYAISARCVGSDPADPDWDATTDEEGNLVDEAGYYTKEIAEEQEEYKDYMETGGWYNNVFKNEDEKYNTDWAQTGTITGINPASDAYWVASRYVSSYSNGSTFLVRNVCTSGCLHYYGFCIVNSSGGAASDSISYGFRPIFTLNSGIKITEGDGVDIPYTLTP